MIKIENHKIGIGHPAFIIAELSANHCGSLRIAKKTIRSMAENGANAVKLQTFTPDTITIDADTPYFRIKKGPWKGRCLYDVYKEGMTPWEWHKELKEIAEEEGLIFLASPFDLTAVDFLNSLGVAAFKIASPEITDIPLIEKCAQTDTPVIFSSGIATLNDIELAISTCRKNNNDQIALLKCTTAYPTPFEEMNLASLKYLQDHFRIVTGISDHSLGSTAAITAVALGANIIEKHFILSRTLNSVDAIFSMEPHEFRSMVDDVRNAESALGNGTYTLTTAMQDKRRFIARSLFVTKDILTGGKLTAQNIRSVRPGNGIHPKHLHSILGHHAKHALSKGTPLQWEDIS